MFILLETFFFKDPNTSLSQIGDPLNYCLKQLQSDSELNCSALFEYYEQNSLGFIIELLLNDFISIAFDSKNTQSDRLSKIMCLKLKFLFQ